MFHPDPAIRFVPASRDAVVALVESLNQPQISIPGKAPQSMQAHLCGLRNANGSCSVFVSLQLSQTAENVIYAHEPRELAPDRYREAEAEGRLFLESMGFMLDDLHFGGMSPEQKDLTLGRMPVFSRPATPPAPSARPDPGRSSAIALLLASF